MTAIEARHPTADGPQTRTPVSMPTSDPATAKSALRKQMRQMLCAHGPEADGVSTMLDRWLAAHPERRTIAVYSPLPGEIDLSQTLLAHPDRRWVFPRVADHDLTFHTGGHLTPGAFGILEPAAGSPEVPVLEIDAFLCPGLAFDRRGGRLGRGRGFYDRLLARVRPDALKLGICHTFQIVADTFPEPHDIPMDGLIERSGWKIQDDKT